MEISASLWAVRLGKDFTFYVFTSKGRWWRKEAGKRANKRAERKGNGAVEWK